MTLRTTQGRRIAARFLLAAAPLTACAPAQAGNGLNLIGFGAESIGLGGADIPMSHEISGININPAGLSQIGERRFDAYLLPFYGYNMKHEDERNDLSRMDNPLGVILGGGYAMRLAPQVVAGVGIFAQGGDGIMYRHLDTPYGTRDEANAIFGVTKLVSGVAWQVNERWALGANLGLSYSQAREKLFPNTSHVPDPDAEGPPGTDPPFFGLRFDGGAGLSLNGRLGLLYKPSEHFTIGASYASPTKLPLKGGTLTVNYEAIGIPKTKYRHARIGGFELAQELGAGFAWQFKPRWLFAMEVNWLDWSGSLKDVRLHAHDPKVDGAPERVDATIPVDYRDQTVLAMGLQIDWSDRTVVRLGTNISRNPAPRSTMTPTLNLIEKWEVDAGFTRKLDDHWELAMGLQYQPPDSIRYDNDVTPIGPSKETYGVVALTIQVGRHW